MQMMQNETDSGAQENTGDGWAMLRVFWRHKWSVVFCIVVGLALGVLYYQKYPRTYESRTQVLIVKKSALPSPVDPTQTTYESPHAVLMTSPLVAEQAAMKIDKTKFPVFDEPGSVAEILDGIEAEGVPGREGDVIVVRYRSRDPDQCPAVRRLGSRGA